MTVWVDWSLPVQIATAGGVVVVLTAIAVAVYLVASRDTERPDSAQLTLSGTVSSGERESQKPPVQSSSPAGSKVGSSPNTDTHLKPVGAVDTLGRSSDIHTPHGTSEGQGGLGDQAVPLTEKAPSAGKKSEEDPVPAVSVSVSPPRESITPGAAPAPELPRVNTTLFVVLRTVGVLRDPVGDTADRVGTLTIGDRVAISHTLKSEDMLWSLVHSPAVHGWVLRPQDADPLSSDHQLLAAVPRPDRVEVQIGERVAARVHDSEGGEGWEMAEVRSKAGNGEALCLLFEDGTLEQAFPNTTRYLQPLGWKPSLGQPVVVHTAGLNGNRWEPATVKRIAMDGTLTLQSLEDGTWFNKIQGTPDRVRPVPPPQLQEPAPRSPQDSEPSPPSPPPVEPEWGMKAKRKNSPMNTSITWDTGEILDQRSADPLPVVVAALCVVVSNVVVCSVPSSSSVPNEEPLRAPYSNTLLKVELNPPRRPDNPNRSEGVPRKTVTQNWRATDAAASISTTGPGSRVAGSRDPGPSPHAALRVADRQSRLGSPVRPASSGTLRVADRQREADRLAAEGGMSFSPHRQSPQHPLLSEQPSAAVPPNLRNGTPDPLRQDPNRRALPSPPDWIKGQPPSRPPLVALLPGPERRKLADAALTADACTHTVQDASTETVAPPDPPAEPPSLPSDPEITHVRRTPSGAASPEVRDAPPRGPRTLSLTGSDAITVNPLMPPDRRSHAQSSPVLASPWRGNDSSRRVVRWRRDGRPAARLGLALGSPAEDVGVTIAGVAAGSTAAVCGCHAGDVLVTVRGKEVWCASDVDTAAFSCLGPHLPVVVRKPGGHQQALFLPWPSGAASGVPLEAAEESVSIRDGADTITFQADGDGRLSVLLNGVFWRSTSWMNVDRSQDVLTIVTDEVFTIPGPSCGAVIDAIREVCASAGVPFAAEGLAHPVAQGDRANGVR
eukprot:Hpha_TRINITY_DN9369_c0_g1::TRINITY_DN9369_c0_g1_i1::g.25906::m.25906